MQIRLGCGVLIAAFAISGSAARAANAPAPASAATPHANPVARFALTPADVTAVFPNPVPPYRAGAEGTAYGRYRLTGLLDAGFRDRQYRAERCEQLPKIPPSEFYPLLARQYVAQPYNSFVAPRAAQEPPAVNGDVNFVNGSLNSYVLCLQGLVR